MSWSIVLLVCFNYIHFCFFLALYMCLLLWWYITQCWLMFPYFWHVYLLYMFVLYIHCQYDWFFPDCITSKCLANKKNRIKPIFSKQKKKTTIVPSKTNDRLVKCVLAFFFCDLIVDILCWIFSGSGIFVIELFNELWKSKVPKINAFSR